MTVWRKSSRSQSGTESLCVEVATVEGPPTGRSN
jgi:hypothetical protein